MITFSFLTFTSAQLDLKGSWYVVPRTLSANLVMFEDLVLSVFPILSQNLCSKTMKGCSCGSEVHCPVLISVCNYDVWL